MLAISPEREHAFWQRVQRTPDSCWEWKGSVTSVALQDANRDNGYGAFILDGRRINAHRMAAALTLPDFDDSLWVLHRCDNKRCCRPSHLFMGTQIENWKDSVEKGRNYLGSERHRQAASDRVRGVANPRAKLTEAQVNDIRERTAKGGVMQKTLAEEYGVSRETIRRITSGLRWIEVA